MADAPSSTELTTKGPTATVLLVEDDTTLAADVVRALSSDSCGLAVWHVETAADARAVLKHQRPDLIVLDLTLPDLDGLVLCTKLPVEAPGVPFIVCSHATTAERVLAFRLGAEDVLPKPFDPAELEVRIAAILRRNGRVVEPRPRPHPHVWSRGPRSSARVGNLYVDLVQWKALLNDQALDLSPTEFQLLAFMSRNPGRILSREELAREVWGNETMQASRTVDAYVRRLRAKLTCTGAPRILNIRGFGYQLAVPSVTAV